MANYRTASYSMSNSHCVEVGESSYRKSRASFANGNCVEVGAGVVVGVRDTKEKNQAVRTELRFPAGSWTAFTGKLKESVT